MAVTDVDTPPASSLGKGKTKMKNQRSAVRNDSRNLRQNSEKGRALEKWTLTHLGHRLHMR